ncbi:hypothetical protein FQN57_006216 [Myotisia sp. PD_48]|nr:hypothetical protein FQN57_006216 [Myotisia sp. PD_48]
MQSIRFTLLFLSLVVLLSLVGASPYDSRGNVGFMKRQDDENTESSQPTRTSSNTRDTSRRTTQTPDSTETNDSESTNRDESATNTDEDSTETGRSSRRSSGSRTSSRPKTTSVDPRSPAGGIEMITPGPFDPTTYVKIGSYATFAWNYTNLIVTPTAIDIVAYCPLNSHYYTLAANQTVQETGAVTWDTKLDKTGDAPLLNDWYTLYVHDSSRGPTDPAPAGHLGNSRPLIFGVYSPKTTNKISKRDNNAAVSDMERQTLFFMFGIVSVVFCSFTVFARGFGLFA